MELTRSQFIQHLRRIYCDTAVPEVVLQKKFSAAAMTPDHSLMVIAPTYDDEGTLKKNIGVIDLGLLLQSLSLENEETVDFEFAETDEGDRLIITEEDGGDMRLVTSAPKIIGTKVSPKDLKLVLENLPEDGVLLEEAAVAKIMKRQAMLSALEVRLLVTEDGTTVRIGPPTGHSGNVLLPELSGDSEYELILQGNTFVRVLGLIDDFSEATIAVTGEDAIVVIKAAGYTYVLSPMEAKE